MIVYTFFKKQQDATVIIVHYKCLLQKTLNMGGGAGPTSNQIFSSDLVEEQK